MRLQMWIGLYVGSEVLLVVEYSAICAMIKKVRRLAGKFTKGKRAAIRSQLMSQSPLFNYFVGIFLINQYEYSMSYYFLNLAKVVYSR